MFPLAKLMRMFWKNAACFGRETSELILEDLTVDNKTKKTFKVSLPEKILAIDTSTRRGSVALYLSSTGEVLEFTADVKKVHAERLLPSVDFILNQSGFHIKEIDLIAVSTGPGSFTGLRIGLATAKGLSFSKGIPVKGVSTLEALANRELIRGGIVCPIIDAGRSEIYYALFGRDRNDNLKKICEESCGMVDDMLNLLRDRKNIYFTGGAIDKYENEIKDHIDDTVLFAPKVTRYLSAITVAECALEKIKAGEDFDNPCLISPFYIRPSDAEENNIKKSR